MLNSIHVFSMFYIYNNSTYKIRSNYQLTFVDVIYQASHCLPICYHVPLSSPATPFIISSFLIISSSMSISYAIFLGHLFIFIYLFSDPIISTHPFSIASLLMSCSIFPLSLFVFRLSLSPLLLYHLYSSLLNRIPTYLFLVISFLCFFSSFICLCLLSFSIISTHPFSIASLLMSCSIFPLSLFVFRLSLSPLLLYHLYSSLLNRIPTYLFLVISFLCFFSSFVCLCLLSFSIISTHPFSIASLLMSCSIFPLSLFVFRLSLSPLLLYHLYSSLLNRIPTYLVLVISFLCFFSSFVCLCLLSFSIISIHPFSIASLLMSCSIFPLFLFVFRLSLSPLLLYHLYSSLLNRIPTYVL